jgi:hypothetical protein
MSLHETPADRANAERLCQIFCDKFGVSDWEELSATSFINFRLYKGGTLFGFLEARVRKADYRHWPTFNISKPKVDKSLELARTHKVPYFMIIEWADAIRYAKFMGHEKFDYIGMWGKDRSGKKVPSYAISIDHFHSMDSDPETGLVRRKSRS